MLRTLLADRAEQQAEEAAAPSRAEDEELLEDAGADLVVTSLDEVSLEAIAEGRLERASLR